MAGHARNVENQWRASATHLRDMARQNEETLARHKDLVAGLADLNSTRVLREAHRRVVPEIDARRGKFEREKANSMKAIEERFERIGASYQDAVPFADMGTGPNARRAGRGETTSRARNDILLAPRPLRDKTNRADEDDDPSTSPRIGGVLGMLRLADEEARSMRADAMQRERDREVEVRALRFHDGKAAAALRRARENHSTRVEAEARERMRADEEMKAFLEAEERSRAMKAQDALAVISRATREMLCGERSVGVAVRMGTKVSTLAEDDSREGRAAKEAGRVASEAKEAVRVAAIEVENSTRHAKEMSERATSARELLREATESGRDAVESASRAEAIVANLIADGQDDAAECCEKTVAAWRSRADGIMEELTSLREECEKVVAASNEAEDARLRAIRTLEEENARHAASAAIASEMETAADAARRDRAAKLEIVKASTIAQFKAMEVAAGMESTAAAVSAAAALGVKSDPADAFALDVAAAERGVADAATAATVANDAANKAKAREHVPLDELAAARSDADEARVAFLLAMCELYAAASAASGCEVTLTFDAAAAAGKRLTACRGPPNAAPAFTGRAGAVTKLKRGFNVLAVDETTDEVMRFENEMDAFDEATANAIGASDRLPPFLLDAFTSLVPLASRVDVAVPNIADEDEDADLKAMPRPRRNAFTPSVFRPPSAVKRGSTLTALTASAEFKSGASKRAAGGAKPADPRRRVSDAIDAYNKTQKTSARTEAAVARAHAVATKARAVVARRSREAVNAATASRMSIVRLATAKRIATAGTRAMEDASETLRLERIKNPTLGAIEELHARVKGYAAAADEAERAVDEHRGALKRATRDLEDVEGDWSEATDVLIEREAAAAIATDAAEEDVDDVDAAADAEDAVADVDDARRERDALAPAVTAAREKREEATRALRVADELASFHRRRTSAARVCVSMDAASAHIAAAACEAADVAAVVGAMEMSMKFKAVAAAAARSKKVAAEADAVVADAEGDVARALAAVTDADEHVRSERDALDACWIALADAEETLARAHADERRAAARARAAAAAAAAAAKDLVDAASKSKSRRARRANDLRGEGDRLRKTRRAERLAKSTAARVTAAQTAAGEVSSLRLRAGDAERALEDADERAELARMKARTAEMRHHDALLASKALREKVDALDRGVVADRANGPAPADAADAADAAETDADAAKRRSPLECAAALEATTREAVKRLKAVAAAAGEAAAAARDASESASRAAKDAAVEEEDASVELCRKEFNGEFLAAEARLEEARRTASRLRAQGPGLRSAVAAAEEASASALALCTEIRKGHEAYDKRLARARRATTLANELAAEAAEKHAAARQKLCEATHALTTAGRRARDASDALERLRARDAEMERKRARAAALEARRRRRDKGAARRAAVPEKSPGGGGELDEDETKAIEKKFDDEDAAATAKLLAKHDRARRKMAHRHEEELLQLEDWHERGGGGGSRKATRKKHAAGEYVKTLFEGYAAHVYRDGGDGLNPSDASQAFSRDPGVVAPAAVSRSRGGRDAKLPETADHEKPFAVAKREMERRHAREAKAFEAKAKTATRRAISSRAERKDAFVRVESARARARKAEATRVEAVAQIASS